jgi:hypothetical protein
MMIYYDDILYLILTLPTSSVCWEELLAKLREPADSVVFIGADL